MTAAAELHRDLLSPSKKLGAQRTVRLSAAVSAKVESTTGVDGTGTQPLCGSLPAQLRTRRVSIAAEVEAALSSSRARKLLAEVAEADARGSLEWDLSVQSRAALEEFVGTGAGVRAARATVPAVRVSLLQ
jgi:hypothetical protein